MLVRKDSTGEVNQEINEGRSEMDGEEQNEEQRAKKPDSQAEIDRILKDRLHRQKLSLTKQFESRVEDLLSEKLSQFGLSLEDLETLRNKKEEGKNEESELLKLKRDQAKVVADLEAQKKAAEKFKSLYTSEKVTSKIEDAAARIGRSSKAQSSTLASLIKDKVKFDDGEIYVLGSDGQVAPELTLDDLVTTTLNDMPFLKGASSARGSGGGPGNDGKNTEPKFDLTTREGRLAHFQHMVNK